MIPTIGLIIAVYTALRLTEMAFAHASSENRRLGLSILCVLGVVVTLLLAASLLVPSTQTPNIPSLH